MGKTYFSPEIVTEYVFCEKGFCSSVEDSIPDLEGWTDEEQI